MLKLGILEATHSSNLRLESYEHADPDSDQHLDVSAP